mmetsp:Transcript_50104/g.141980  ORF Transcript_50104/g.141980 Transcript_50104/m.141980 type:complete len:518 (-) Transcript_50104:38-1591(-)
MEAKMAAAEASFLRGRQLHQTGHCLEEAEAAYASAHQTLRSLPADRNSTIPWEADLLHLFGAMRIQRLLGKLQCEDEDDDCIPSNADSERSAGTGAIAKPSLPDGADAALQLSERAAFLRPDDWRIWNSLGVGRYKIACRGRHASEKEHCLKVFAALQAFRRASEIPGGTDGWGPLDGMQRALRHLGKADGALKERVDVLKKMGTLRPEDGKLFYRLGTCLQELGGRNDEAVKALEHHLEIVGNCGWKSAHTQHWLAMLKGQTPKTAPAEYVASLFDFYAERFEDHLVKSLQYCTPGALLEDLCTVVAMGHMPASTVRRAADLGAGTGLLGPLLCEKLGMPVQRLEGVDLSAEMLRRAVPKACYDLLLAADLLQVFRPVEVARSAAAQFTSREVCILPPSDGTNHGLEAPTEEEDFFDLVAAADVFVYIGDLSEVFEETRRWMAAGGIFGFSVESAKEAVCPNGYTLCDTGRFAHRPEYIESLAAQHGFQVERARDLVLRQNAGQPVHGRLFVLRAF